jgi:hypothetical protein
MSRRVTTKRVLTALLVLLAASVVAIKLINQHDAARTEREQYSVYSAYLFSIPVLERPLPTECREDPRYTGGQGVVEIRQYFVSDETISEFSRPSVLWHVPHERRAARWAPTSVFSNFVIRNLFTETLKATSFQDSKGQRPEMVKDSRYMPMTDQPTLLASFTKAGFNRDFTKAMFYAEISCGGKTGREYVVMEKVPYGGRFWYWYAVRVDRE